MEKIKDNVEFWKNLDILVETSEIVIDRSKGTHHPTFTDFIYPLDYGYLKNTTSMDNGGIDIWIGSGNSKQVDAIICTVDMVKRDSEMKLLYSCTQEEKHMVYKIHNEQHMNGVLIER